MMNNFTCLTLSPIALPHYGIALATARAGGIGILDGEFCQDIKTESLLPAFEQLLHWLTLDQVVGLRLSPRQISGSMAPFFASLGDRSYWLVVCGWRNHGKEELLPGPSTNRRLLVEVTDVGDMERLRALQVPMDGIVARGFESGGWIGEDSAFILVQKLLPISPWPVYVQGGIGIHTAGACRAAGAAGVIVDDGLWRMPESPLSSPWAETTLKNAGGRDCIVLGEGLGAPVRVLSHPGSNATARLQEIAETLERADTDMEGRQKEWREKATEYVGWDTDGNTAYPVGQALEWADRIPGKFRTTGRYVQALLKTSLARVTRSTNALLADGPMAKSHNTRYPIVQGPMTRVSDTERFADAVSRAGALPMMGLGLLRGDEALDLLTRTRDRLGDRPWGVGILGFIPPEHHAEQWAIVQNIAPKFALIAGGEPSQAARLEEAGIATYLHTPTASLTRAFFQQGLRRFVFEGRECGGHIGPLGGFALWEDCVEALLDVAPPDKAREIHVLFAGGIHDARSAAMVDALAAPLTDLGMKIGVLMGSAYLFTREAVECGAITEGFQQQAIRCTHTASLETGPGHVSRCAVTPFVAEFHGARRRLMEAEKGKDEIMASLDELCLGRLRLAAKGLARKGAEVLAVDGKTQLSEGMYMLGQVATLRDSIISARELHETVCPARIGQKPRQDDAPILDAASAVGTDDVPAPSDIAIIGIGLLLPRANSPEDFWQNILAKTSAVTEVPSSRWDWRAYYDPDRNRRDRIVSKWGCFLDDVAINLMDFGIPPKAVPSIEPGQLLTLEVVRRALADAGYMDGARRVTADLDRENTSIILGLTGGLGELGQHYITRAEITRRIPQPPPELLADLPEWTEDSFPGILPNVSAGRVAKYFDFGGANFTVDSACASSLTAIDLAVRELETGRCNVAITGGVDTIQSPFAYLCFSKTQALSPRGKIATFDKKADGTLLGEGLVVLVLKRLADAKRDGDRIYAIIKATAGSSDGRGPGLTAPSSTGQRRALDRAYAKAGFTPATLGFYEAHGTGTVAGDETEIKTITDTLLANEADPGSCALGSVKSLIGHTKSTAGAAGLVKSALSLYYRALPPQPNVEDPLEELRAPKTPVYLLNDPAPWLQTATHPRRAAVSAFGFGGANCHGVLEEYQGGPQPVAAGAERWPWEFIPIVAPDKDALRQELSRLAARIGTGERLRPRDVAYSYAMGARAAPVGGARLGLVVENLQGLADAIGLVKRFLDGEGTGQLPPFIQLSLDEVTDDVEKPEPPTAENLAFLFPGQGAQYPGMGQEIAFYFPEMRWALEFAGRTLQDEFPEPLTKYLFPLDTWSESARDEAKRALTATEVAQPAIGTVEMGYLSILNRLGVSAGRAAGHSYGEYAALFAAGVLSPSAFLRLSLARGQAMARACEATDGAMAAVDAPREDVERCLSGHGDVMLANHNGPRQAVISGARAAVRRVVGELAGDGVDAALLPVAGAFHSGLMATARELLDGAIGTAGMATPGIRVFSNITGSPYPDATEAIRAQLSGHLLAPVEFHRQIEAMYEAGSRVFIEAGPRRILSGLVAQILGSRPHVTVSLDGNGGGLRGFLIALATLFTQGAPFDYSALFTHRGCHSIDALNLPDDKTPSKSPTRNWLVNGSRARFMNTVAMDSLTNPSGKDRSQETTGGRFPDDNVPTNAIDDLPMNNEQQSASPPEESHGWKDPTLPGRRLDPDTALSIYQEYQKTMRRFLALEEQVISLFFGASVAPDTVDGEGRPAVRCSKTDTPHGEPFEDRVPPIQEPAPAHPSDLMPQTRGPAPEPDAPAGREPESSSVEQAQSIRQTADAPAPDLPDHAALLDLLTRVTSESTGYPPEMLEPDQDLEGELGIDSIKRVEIVVRLRERLSSEFSIDITAQTGDFTRIRTLNGLVEAIEKELGEKESEGSLSAGEPSSKKKD